METRVGGNAIDPDLCDEKVLVSYSAELNGLSVSARCLCSRVPKYVKTLLRHILGV
jgi:hypothetical protein